MARKRRPFVAVETDVAKDESFAVLADICGISRDEALGKIVRLWAWCADRKLQDAPEGCPGYAVPEAVITRWFGPDGIRGILGDGCEAFALGARWPGGLIYLRGTDETVAARRMQLAGARAGGESRIQGERDAHGRFVAEDTNSPAGSPAGSRVDPRSQIPDPSPEKNSLPRAIPPSTEPAAVPAAPPAADRPAVPPPVPQPGKSAWHRRAGWWALMLEADARVRAAGIEPNAPPMPKACAGENERNLNACEKQLLEGGDDAETVDRKLRHLIAYRERECIRDRTRRWLSPAALWDPKRANYAFDRPLDEADKSPMARAGPRSSAARAEQPTIRPKTTDDEPPPIPSWSKA